MYIMSVEALHNYTCISFKDNKEMSVEKQNKTNGCHKEAVELESR